ARAEGVERQMRALFPSRSLDANPRIVVAKIVGVELGIAVGRSSRGFPHPVGCVPVPDQPAKLLNLLLAGGRELRNHLSIENAGLSVGIVNHEPAGEELFEK